VGDDPDGLGVRVEPGLASNRGGLAVASNRGGLAVASNRDGLAVASDPSGPSGAEAVVEGVGAAVAPRIEVTGEGLPVGCAVWLGVGVELEQAATMATRIPTIAILA
jgi:hypothetical protein